ncbi:MAG: hypothetical protein AAF196_03060 [Planctomycetota bacterium]
MSPQPLTELMHLCLIDIAQDGLARTTGWGWESRSAARTDHKEGSILALASRGLIEVEGSARTLDRSNLTKWGRRQLVESCRLYSTEVPEGCES